MLFDALGTDHYTHIVLSDYQTLVRKRVNVISGEEIADGAGGLPNNFIPPDYIIIGF